MRRPRPVVVTDMREPLVVVHRRLIRERSILLGIWILGWAATGFVHRTAWLALLILAVTGPMLWVAVWVHQQRTAPGRREPVGRPEIRGPGAPGAGAGR